MKLILTAFLFVFTFLFIGAKAQQTHFIYIQTSNKQAFYVKLNNKIYSSSASGYMILSKLVDSTYNLSIGFPKNEWPQQNLTCTINRKDLGYILKNFGDKGWGLLNLQTLDVSMANNNEPVNKNIVREERTDSFSNMLSAVVNDPTIKQNTIIKKEIKLDTTQPAQKTETVVVEDMPKEKPAKIPVKEATLKSAIKKLLQNKNADGTELVYIDNNSTGSDTVRIFIPADKTIIAEPVKQEEKAEEQKVVAEAAVIEPVATKQENTPVVEKPIVKPAPVAQKESIIVANKTTNSNCKNFATEDDFLKLRKKMAAEAENDNMVNMARKVFKTKCFKTEQIKNLGFLFLNDAGRYSFFDMSYPYVSDPENYNSLQSQLTDPYYLNRFKAMLHQ